MMLLSTLNLTDTPGAARDTSGDCYLGGHGLRSSRAAVRAPVVLFCGTAAAAMGGECWDGLGKMGKVWPVLDQQLLWEQP